MIASPSAFFKLAAIINGVHPEESYTGSFQGQSPSTSSSDIFSLTVTSGSKFFLDANSSTIGSRL